MRKLGKIVWAVASSGIAATLLLGGKPIHRALKLPLNLIVNDTATCNIGEVTGTAELLNRCSMIIWDECAMSDKVWIWIWFDYWLSKRIRIRFWFEYGLRQAEYDLIKFWLFITRQRQNKIKFNCFNGYQLEYEFYLSLQFGFWSYSFRKWFNNL